MHRFFHPIHHDNRTYMSINSDNKTHNSPADFFGFVCASIDLINLNEEIVVNLKRLDAGRYGDDCLQGLIVASFLSGGKIIIINPPRYSLEWERLVISTHHNIECAFNRFINSLSDRERHTLADKVQENLNFPHKLLKDFATKYEEENPRMKMASS